VTSASHVAPPPDPPVVEGYVLGPLLGAGAVGVVHRARELSTGRDVAIKWLAGGPTADGAARARFEREARLAARIRHPNVVTLFAAGTTPTGSYLVLELVEGASLARLLQARALGPRALAAVVAGAARGLQAAHDQGVLHRDLKPDNVLVDRSGAARLVDFGVACLAVEQGRLSGPGVVSGTLLYLAPEVLGQTAAASPASDVYALGVSLREGLAGAHPFEAETVAATYGRILAGTAAPLPDDLPDDLRAACAAATALDPAARPTAIGLAKLLEREAGPSENPATASSVADPAVSPARRRGAAWPMALGLVLAAGAAAAAAALRNPEAVTGEVAPGDPTTETGAAPLTTVVEARLAHAAREGDVAALAAIVSEVVARRAPPETRAAALTALGRAQLLGGLAEEASATLGAALVLDPACAPALFAAWGAAVVVDDRAAADRLRAQLVDPIYAPFLGAVEQLQRSPFGGAGPGGRLARRQGARCPDPEVYEAAVEAVAARGRRPGARLRPR